MAGIPFKYRSEDGVEVKTGDKVFNYYDMKPGTIGSDSGSGWFQLDHDDGTHALLNGQRICTMEFAARNKFKNAVLA